MATAFGLVLLEQHTHLLIALVVAALARGAHRRRRDRLEQVAAGVVEGRIRRCNSLLLNSHLLLALRPPLLGLAVREPLAALAQQEYKGAPHLLVLI